MSPPQTKRLRTAEAMSPDILLVTVSFRITLTRPPGYANSDTARDISMPNIHLYRILPLIIYPCEQGKSR